MAEVGSGLERRSDEVLVDAEGAIAMPGLVDCHPHTCFAGSRVGDFVRRLGGESYGALLQGGGGIFETVRATRMATVDELSMLTATRLEAMLALGVTTVEIKSGYGLDLRTESRMIDAVIDAAGPVEVLPTYLAHVIPKDVDRVAWVDAIVNEHLAAVCGRVRAVDVYCDDGAFTLREAAQILRAARGLGLGVHVHAEQVAYTGVAELAAKLGALSADHLERLDAGGAEAMGQAGTVAVLLPGAMLYLRDTPPPVDLLRKSGVSLAVATDFNPGTSPLPNLWTAATLACLTMRLTPDEALAGITRVAGAALGRPDLGRLAPGSAGDLALYRPPVGEPPSVECLLQYMGGAQAFGVWKSGERVV